MAQNDWKIGLLGGLDGTKSRSQLNSDIKGLAKSLDKLKIYTEIDPNQAKQLQNQLKKLQVELNNITVSDAVINGLVKRINDGLKGIQIGNIGLGGQAQQVGQQIGQQLNQGISQGMGRNAQLLDNFRKSLSNIGMSSSDIDAVAKRIENLGVQITSLNQSTSTVAGKKGDKNLLSLEVSGIDKLGQAVTLTETWDRDAMQLVKSLDAVSTAQQKSTNKAVSALDKFEKARKTAVASQQNRLNQIAGNIEDKNHSKPITSTEQLKKVEDATRAANDAMKALEASTEETFDDMLIGAKEAITQLKIVEKQARNADNVPTKLKGVDFGSGKSIASNNLDAFIAKAKDIPKMAQTVTDLQKAFATVGDVASLNDFNNQLKVAQSELTKVKAEMSAIGDLEDKIATIKFKVDSGNGASEYQNKLTKLANDFDKYGVSAEEAKQKIKDLQSLVANGFKDGDGNWLPDEQIIAQADSIERELKSLGVVAEEAKIKFDKLTQPVSDDKAASLINRINNFLYKNTAITQEAKDKLQGFVRTLQQGATLNKWNEINGEFKKLETQMRGLGKLGASLKNQMKQAAESFTQWVSVSSAIMLLITKTKQAVTELKEVDTLLTEISKANDKLSKSQLAGIGDRSFETASRYGKKATDYLKGVQEMSRAGYQNAEAMGELSVKAQGAGDMTEDVANKFIVATDKAYKLNGSLTDLTKIMDGINYITNHNAINMTELSEGFSIVGSTAASFGVEANELTAALATMGASTQQSGSEVARAFRAILLNIRQVSDEEEGIDAEGLTKYENACNALGVSLKKTVNGVQELRDPMEVLGELSKKYKELSDTDIKKVNLLNSVGGKLRATQLDALLRGWEDYEKMLGQFEAGTGSMQKEAEKTANSWEGSMNRLSNTWTDTIGNIANSSVVTTLVNGLNGVLTIVNGITSALGTFGTVGLSVIALMAKNGITFRDVWTSITGGVKMNAPKYARHTAVVTLNELMMNMVSLTRLYVAMPEME